MNMVELYKKFPDQASCIQYLEEKRWKGNPTCPYCESTNQTPIRMEHRYHCNNCNISYSVTVRTIFHKTKLDLQVWFLAISLILNAKNGISARQLGRDLGVNKNTAWFMSIRIRKAMVENIKFLEGIEGIVEVDESYIGGKDSGCKRGMVGQYHKVRKRHLQKYLNEFCYRHNNRDCDDLFDLSVSRALEV